MSLNASQRRLTSTELRANLELAGGTVDELADRAGRTRGAVTDALDVTPGADPVLVWELRDLLETAVEAKGLTPVPYTSLTEGARRSAAGWFGISPTR
jgi:hypothetical protein